MLWTFQSCFLSSKNRIEDRFESLYVYFLIFYCDWATSWGRALLYRRTITYRKPMVEAACLGWGGVCDLPAYKTTTLRLDVQGRMLVNHLITSMAYSPSEQISKRFTVLYAGNFWGVAPAPETRVLLLTVVSKILRKREYRGLCSVTTRQTYRHLSGYDLRARKVCISKSIANPATISPTDANPPWRCKLTAVKRRLPGTFEQSATTKRNDVTSTPDSFFFLNFWSGYLVFI